jgi:hypothetical protein
LNLKQTGREKASGHHSQVLFPGTSSSTKVGRRAKRTYHLQDLGSYKQITINVVKIENSETIHMVELELEGDDIAEKSRVINRFINGLISRPNSEQKTKE